MIQKRSIIVSQEFTAFVGRGACNETKLPPRALIFGFGDIGEPTVARLERPDLSGFAVDHLVILAISRNAALRIFGPLPRAGGRWYLSSQLRGIGRELLGVEGDGESRDMLRAARSQELLVELFAALADGKMVEVEGPVSLGELDIGRVAAAHALITERWQEKLTVSSVAKRCGLSKVKLTQGFRELYRCTVPEAIAERRLQRARQLLAQSDLHVATIGYECGYMSNASFARAFARRFGMSPTVLRRVEAAAA